MIIYFKLFFKLQKKHLFLLIVGNNSVNNINNNSVKPEISTQTV